MGRKCCVPGCQSNYEESKAKNKKLKTKNDGKNLDRNDIDTFGFPSKKTCLDERIKWIQAIPILTEEIVDKLNKPSVCVKHWRSDFQSQNLKDLKTVKFLLLRPKQDQHKDRRLR